MHIAITRTVEASEPDDDGFFDYYYEYDLFRMTDERDAFVARSYVATPEEAHFLQFESEGIPSPVCEAHLKMALFAEAFLHLKNTGKTEINWQGPSGYESVAPSI